VFGIGLAGHVLFLGTWKFGSTRRSEVA